MPSKFDEGKPRYESIIYKQLLPHCITLTEIHRQNKEKQHSSIAALDDLRYGGCSKETEQLIKILNRPTARPKPLHLYLTNIEVEAHNAEQLHILEGPRQEFVASECSNIENIQCPTGKLVYFKEGAPVVVIYNISEEIHNGTPATFVARDGDEAIVKVKDVGEVKIQRVTWANYSEDGEIIGRRCQIPLKLFWASTVNKVQGQEIDSVCFHSSYEFTGGLVYTAISRVKRAEDVEVRDFIPAHVKFRDSDIEKMKSLSSEPFKLDCSCCKHHVETKPCDVDHDKPQENVIEDIVEHVTNCSGDESEFVARTFLDRRVEDQREKLVDLEMFLKRMEDSKSFISDPPDDFDFTAMLCSYKDSSRLAKSVGFSVQKNALIEEVIACERKMKNAEAYIKILWKGTASKMKKFLRENVQDTRISRAQFSKLCEDVWKSNSSCENHEMLKSLFAVKANEMLTAPMLSLGANLNYGVFQNILHIISDVLRSHKTSTTVPDKFGEVDDMDDAGRAKVIFQMLILDLSKGIL